MPIRLAFVLWAGVVLLHGQIAKPRTTLDADRLEAHLKTTPDDVNARLMLLRFYSDPENRVTLDRLKAALRHHAVWMIEHHPENPTLREQWAAITREGRRGSDPEAFEAADRAWRRHLAEPSPKADVYTNAATFYKFVNPAFARKVAADGRKAYPNDAEVGYATGMLDGLAILQARSEDDYTRVSLFDDSREASELARDIRRSLETSKDGAVLGGAGRILGEQLYSLDLARRNERALEIAELAENYLQRAIQLDAKDPRWAAPLSLVYSYRATRTSDWKEKIGWLEKSAAAADEESRLPALDGLADAHLQAGDYEKAAETARELLALAPKHTSSWAYGNAIHRGNIVLGRVALHRGDNAEAARRLLAAGRTKGSPQLDSFGPDWNLASQLLARGDRNAVLTYIDLCRKFWAMGTSRLNTWSAAIRSGRVPNFDGSPDVTKPDLAGRAAPAFRLPRLKGGEVSLETYRGKVVLLDFWATWCAPCRAEMPTFEKLHREFGDRDVVIVAIDVDESEDVVADYITKEKYSFPVLLADQTEVGRYRVHTYPSLVSVDRDGKVVEYLIGGRTESELREAIARARAGAPSPSAPPRTKPARKLLASPRQLSPEPGKVFPRLQRETTVTWGEVPGAAAYVVEWDFRDGAHWNMERSTGSVTTIRVTEPVATMRIVGAQSGRWRVMAVDAAGNSGEVSGWRDFRYAQ